MRRIRKKMPVICTACGQSFEKHIYEVQKSKSGNHFCSPKCAGPYLVRLKFGDSVGFGFYSSNCKKNAKSKGLAFDLDPKFLKDLFDSQDGRCALSGIKMTMNSSCRTKDQKSIYYASVDRIDNAKGYTKGNVQFLCLGINYMRNTFSIEEVNKFLNKLQSNVNPGEVRESES